MTADKPESANIITERINQGPMSAYQILIILICFLINVADGFDVLAMSYAAPALREDWGVDPSQLGIIFSAALAGMTIGAMFLSSLSDKLGRRTVILMSVGLSSVAMLATPFTGTINELVLVRFLTGLGIGGVLASAASMATEYSPARFSGFAVIIVQSGYALGSVIAGPVAGHVIPQDGWQQLFWYGGLLTGALFVLAWLLLPESIEYLASKPGDRDQKVDKINALLARIKCEPIQNLPEVSATESASKGSIKSLVTDFRRQTFKLWIIFFSAFWSTYFLVNWIPTLFVTSGFTQAEGIYALTVYTLGGLIGAQILGVASTRIPLTTLILVMFMTTVALLGAFTVVDLSSSVVLNTLVFAIGFTYTAGFTAMYAVAAQSYPTEVRATGVGWCIGLGRAGAVLSPYVAGLMVSAGWGMSELILVIAIPPILLASYFVWKLSKPAD